MSLEAERAGKTLMGKGVLITRPIAQSSELKKLLLEKGATPIVFPTLEITYASADSLAPQLSDIQQGQLLIFISPNAVKGVFQDISAAHRKRLASARIAAVGRQTRAALEAQGISVSSVPDEQQQNTEGLLNHPDLQNLQGESVMIIRAQAGRETLRERLQTKGAHVEYLQAYQRAIPAYFNPAPVIAALKSGEIQLVLLSSYDAYSNLTQMLGDHAERLLAQTCVVVPSKRVARKINPDVAPNICIANNASDEAMLAAVVIACQ